MYLSGGVSFGVGVGVVAAALWGCDQKASEAQLTRDAGSSDGVDAGAQSPQSSGRLPDAGMAESSMEQSSVAGVAGEMGDTCGTDRDCVSGLGCMLASSYDYFGFGGPAGGYCTAPCSDTVNCQDLQAGALCLRNPGDRSTGLCMRGCTSQDPIEGENKCLERSDVACNSLAAAGQERFLGIRQAGFCRPLCASDAECPGTRVCHPSGGMCVDAEDDASGLEIGASCAVNDDCRSSLCEEVANDLRICSQLCVLGQSGGCGFTEDAEARNAACLTARIKANRFSEGVGDLGLCREICRADSDCQHADEGWVCRDLRSDAAEFFGVAGACVPPAAP